jgi:glucose/arabinose dehydrogenase/cytochrome c2
LSFNDRPVANEGHSISAGLFPSGELYNFSRRSRRLRAVTILVSFVLNAACSAPHEMARPVSGDNQSYWVEQVTEGLNVPSSMAWLPNGDIIVTERMGGLRLLRDGKLDPTPIGGTPQSFQNGPADGLKDILVDADFKANQAIYLLLSEGTVDRHHAAVYRARLIDHALVDLHRIFRSKDDISGAGRTIASRMTFLADKTLLVAVAADLDHLEQAQRLDSHMGKILRITRDGSAPSDNPFINTPGALPEVWSYGHRVVMGIYENPKGGGIAEIETGPVGGDKFDFIEAGKNYGWPKTSWGFAYQGGLAAPLQVGPGIEDPILIWMPTPGKNSRTLRSQDPSGLTHYLGNLYPSWSGDYFVGHLPTRELERLRIEGSHVVLQEKMLADLEERIRDVKVGPDNHIYILTDNPDGRLLRLQPGRPRAGQLARVAHNLAPIQRIGGSPIEGDRGDPVRGQQAFVERCVGCHSMGTAIRGGVIGPNLEGVYGRGIGKVPDFPYSIDLGGSLYRWDVKMLNRFLADPTGLFPGTKMTAAPVTDAQTRMQIIGFLSEQSGAIYAH